MYVTELSKEQFAELKESYFYQLMDCGETNGVACPEDIPDTVIEEHYTGINFVNDDFFCTMGK